MNIMVTGATGYIGGQLVPRLISAGHQVTCLARKPQMLNDRRWENIQIKQGDVLDLESLRPAMEKIDIAYYLIHSMAGGKQGFEERDEVAARNFGTAAREAGVQRIIYLGGLGECEKFLSPHLYSRQYAGEVLRLTGVPVTEFRAPIVIGSGSMSFEMIRYLTERLPILPTPPWIDTLCQPIAIENILDYLITSLNEPRSIGEIYEIGGPDVLTYKEIMRGYAVARGLKRSFITIPFLNTPFLALGADVITPLPPPYLQILIAGLRSEVLVHDPSAQEVFKLHLIPYATAVQQALTRDGSGEVESYWAGKQKGLEPGVTHKDTQGVFIVQHRTASAAEPNAIFHSFSGIGGKRGWFYANILWKLRGWLDQLVGGVGMGRGRRDPDTLKPGDILDGWRVEAVDEGRLIRLWFEMKAPGPAWLQFEAQLRPDGGSLLNVTAFFEPHGIHGLVYWFTLYPFHSMIFNGMSREIIRRAESSIPS